MDIIVVFNGLGNQMSQYAFYLEKKLYNKNTIFILDKNSQKDHNGFELNRVFGITDSQSISKNILYYIFRFLHAKKFPLGSKLIIKALNVLGFRLHVEAKNYDFDEKMLEPTKKGVNFYYGGWHSEKYFDGNRTRLRELYTFKNTNDPILISYLKDIEQSESISIHVRRGDYLSSDLHFEMYGSVCTLDYYQQAIGKIRSLVSKPRFYIFSNDTEWVKENGIFEGMVIVEGFQGKDSWKDMFLISKCKHNINSNSTFSWWGAWLNQNIEKHVVVPYYFINKVETKDFYPKNWIRIR